MKENCGYCHALGTSITRQFPFLPVEVWDGFTQHARDPGDNFFAGDKTYHTRDNGARMNSIMKGYGKGRGLAMLADWSSRIAKGEVPKPRLARPV